MRETPVLSRRAPGAVDARAANPYIGASAAEQDGCGSLRTVAAITHFEEASARKESPMTTVDVEHVLVVPTSLLHTLGYFQGFTGEVDRYLGELLNGRHASYRPRPEMERDPSFKQLIPYLIFRYTDAGGNVCLFEYTRGTGQGEQRLHRKRSVGVGGHISSTDADAAEGGHPYHEGMRRELEEEVIIDTPWRDACVGLINDDQTEVGRVHLGVVHLIDVERPAVRPRESEMIDAGFRPLASVMSDLAGMETWSQICLRALFGGE